MERTFARSHLTAVIGGIIFGVFCAGISSALPPQIVLTVPIIGVFLFIPTFLGTFFVRWLARLLAPYDLFTALAGTIALVLAFGLGYVNSIDSWLRSTGRVHGMILGAGPQPDALGDQLFVFLSDGIWIGAMVALGLRWARAQISSPIAPTSQRAKIATWIALDTVLIWAATFALLAHLLQQRLVWSSPEQVFARAQQTLEDSQASEGDRALALNTISNSRDERAVDLLRRIVQTDKGPLRILAAADLLGKDDMLALPILAPILLHASKFSTGNMPTTSHTPSEGNGVQIAGFSSSVSLGVRLRQVKDPAAAPILIQLMESSDAETRRGAASALRNLGSQASMGAMIVGLDDSDEMVRYFSVCTLMELNGDSHYPATQIFEDNEDDYLAQWKKWAKDQLPPPP